MDLAGIGRGRRLQGGTQHVRGQRYDEESEGIMMVMVRVEGRTFCEAGLERRSRTAAPGLKLAAS